MWILRNLCLPWCQIHAVRFFWEDQLWYFIEKFYTALKVNICQWTEASSSTLLPCLDIVKNYVYTMQKKPTPHMQPAGGQIPIWRHHHECCLHDIFHFKTDVLIAGKLWIIREEWDIVSRSVKKFHVEECRECPTLTLLQLHHVSKRRIIPFT